MQMIIESTPRKEKGIKTNQNLTFWRFNILSYSWSTSSKLAPDFRFSIFAATKSLLSLIHLKSIEAFHWGFATNPIQEQQLQQQKNTHIQNVNDNNKDEKNKLPFSSPAVVVWGSTWTSGNERARTSNGDGGLWLRKQGWRELREGVLVGGLKIRREVEEVGKAASLRVCRVVALKEEWNPIVGALKRPLLGGKVYK